MQLFLNESKFCLRYFTDCMSHILRELYIWLCLLSTSMLKPNFDLTIFINESKFCLRYFGYWLSHILRELYIWSCLLSTSRLKPNFDLTLYKRIEVLSSIFWVAYERMFSLLSASRLKPNGLAFFFWIYWSYFFIVAMGRIGG